MVRLINGKRLHDREINLNPGIKLDFSNGYYYKT